MATYILFAVVLAAMLIVLGRATRTVAPSHDPARRMTHRLCSHQGREIMIEPVRHQVPCDAAAPS